MKTRHAHWMGRFGPLLAMTCGMVVLSQGPSFGLWNPFASPRYNHNFHAILLTVIGVGLFVSGPSFFHVLDRVRALEQRASFSEDANDS